MTPMIAHLNEITDVWLSSAVGQPVRIVARRSNDAFNSAITHLTVQCESPDIPERLIVKLNADGAGEYEIRFYQLASDQPAPLPMLPRTLAFAYDSGQSYIVQEDLSATHRIPVTRHEVLTGRGVPSDSHLQQMTDALARFHAYWWERRVESLPVRPWYGNESQFDAHIQRRQREWATFTDKAEDFPADLHQLYADVLARLPQLWPKYLEPRITSFRGLTLSNGDCYFAQFLCPIQGDGQAYLVDFQEASVNVAAFDLVFMYAIFWTPEQRHENDREARLLRQYYDVLCQQGVIGYTWDNLMQDYCLMLTLILFFPIFDAVSGASYDYWWPKMQCLVENFRDLDCAALL